MPRVFEELWRDARASFADEVPLEAASILARHFWPDGTQLDLHANASASADAIGRAFGAKEARAYRAFCGSTRQIYATSEPYFIRAQRMTLRGIVTQFGAAGLTTLVRLDAHRTMAQALSKSFDAPRLRQLFGRYATYVGSSPFEAPATLNLVAHVEADGVYRPEGGIAALVRGLVSLAERVGVTLSYGREVDRIIVSGGRASGVEVAGERIEADVVVFNGDVGALGAGLLGRRASKATSGTPRGLRSLSALTWTLSARASGPALHHHNVFFTDADYRSEFEAIFGRDEVSPHPTVYICAQDRDDSTEDASGPERMLVVVNAPPNGDEPGRWSPTTRQRCTQSMTNTLQATGLSLIREDEVMTTPEEFHRAFPGTGGALYGPRTKGARSVLTRAGAATKIRGLYLAGGSVHPGAGVPMSALSGRLAAVQICEDLGSISRSFSGVTTGNTSMR